ncbi:LOW QUALITY PROTEIN: uncharacterized protein LOC133730368 [Rosa rugosa]|uniref:LOW QUALITY PROTEIN: uncharacterized protein LOC133730368 n=1 Tax=Rosa rugosa TaxID=74645 RepID=UPI002B40AE17|nr:LOW QUALITY PROTEIN: uncharacterized protein LOC133730368 [Rosa rugosa]
MDINWYEDLHCLVISSIHHINRSQTSPRDKFDTSQDYHYCIVILRETFDTRIVGLYPEGSPSRNSRGHKANPGPGGGLEIVFNQQ